MSACQRKFTYGGKRKVKSDWNCDVSYTLDTISAFRFAIENEKTDF
jgi:hypothetical protein